MRDKTGGSKMINWSKITKTETLTIHKIAKRTIKLIPQLRLLDIEMDISAGHLEKSLDLNKLLDFPDLDFTHDIVGISNNINRTTGILDNCFLPRCSA